MVEDRPHPVSLNSARSFDRSLVIFVGAQAQVGEPFIDLQQPPEESALNLLRSGIR